MLPTVARVGAALTALRTLLTGDLHFVPDSLLANAHLTGIQWVLKLFVRR